MTSREDESGFVPIAPEEKCWLKDDFQKMDRVSFPRYVQGSYG